MSDEKNNSSRVRAFMGQTPKNLKQKFFSVLGTSSEYKKQFVAGLSNKIDAALSFGSTSETTPENVNEAKLRAKLKQQHEKATAVEYSLDDHIVDYELRRVKEKRAYEEISSGCYRHPAFIDRATGGGSGKDNVAMNPENVVINQPAIDNNIDQSHKNECTTSTTTISHHLTNISLSTTNNKSSKALNTKENLLPPASCSTATSESDSILSLIDGSSESSSLEVKMWQTESMALAPSCSSIASMETSSDEVTCEFMRRFVTTLFTDSTGITLELKHQFGQYARLAAGRMWFARSVNGQRTQSKKVSETTFFALIQYFAIILFECKDCEDFLPARYLMSLCFTFYQEVQVPGCEPYREYLFSYLRDQPIWHALRFWNAALFYALQKDKVPKSSNDVAAGESSLLKPDDKVTLKQASRSISESSVSSSSSSSHENALKSDNSKYKPKIIRSKSSTTAEGGGEDNTFDTDEHKRQCNMAFSHLGSLTCNMHAFGLNRELCCEFVKKQCHILSLSKEQEKILNENVNRLYRETDPWRQ